MRSFPGPTVSSMGKREPKVDIRFHQYWRITQMAHLGLICGNHWESAEIKHWGLYRDKVAWLTETSTQILADHIAAYGGN